MKALLAIVVLFACFRAVPSYGQPGVEEAGKIIGDAFVKKFGAAPELGWILPNGELITEVNSKEVTILAEKVEARVASQIGVIPAKAVKQFVKKNQVDCDQLDEKTTVPLYQYVAKMPPAKHVTRVFVLAGDEAKDLRAGYVAYKPSEAQVKAIWLAMGFRAGQKRLMKAAMQADSHLFYSFASIYKKDGKQTRQGTFLQDASGKILAHSIEDISEEDLCDGCEMPTYAEESQQANPPVLNLVSMSGPAYPMVLEDSGTVEGRAISLFTFSPSGEGSEYRKYEYVVTCILGPDPDITRPKAKR